MASISDRRVYVVVPTFNRWSHTRVCLDLLFKQSWRDLVVIVSDGGSSDGTREYIRRDYPAVQLVYDNVDRWWAGSTALGVLAALKQGRDDDFVLMLNNDTEIPTEYVSTLVSVSCRENAAVGAKIVDSRDPTHVLDAGEYIDWSRYEFPVRSDALEDATYIDDVDVLPGRGSLIPISMIKSAGNVDYEKFPHYLADYDFFCRLKKRGFRLGVTYETFILAHIEETGIIPREGRVSFKAVFAEFFSRRSMTNVRDHLRFANRHAPPHLKSRVRRLIVVRALNRLFLGTSLRYVVVPLQNFRIGIQSFLALSLRIWRQRAHPDSRFMILQMPRHIAKLGALLFLPRPVSMNEITDLGLDIEKLQSAGILEKSNAPNWFRVATIDPNWALDPASVQIITRATVPLTFKKLCQLLAYRSSKTNPSTGSH